MLEGSAGTGESERSLGGSTDGGPFLEGMIGDEERRSMTVLLGCVAGCDTSEGLVDVF
jgi:hypothetical protein